MVCWINRDRWLVRRITEDVIAIGIDIHLEAGEQPELGNHARPCLPPVNVRRRHVVFFQRLGPERLAGRRLPRSSGK